METSEILQEITNYLRAKDYTLFPVSKIRKFLRYCTENGLDFSKITLNELNGYILSMKGKIQNSTINNEIKAIRLLYKFLSDNDYVKNEASDKLSFLPVDKVDKPFITRKELDDIVDTLHTFSDLIGHVKAKAILYFMFFSGLRREEFLNLKRDDFDFEKKRFLIKDTKNNKIEKGYITPDFEAEVLEYFASEPEDRNAFNISVKQLKYFIKQINEMNIVETHITPHLFRHSAAHYYLHERGMSLPAVKKILHHASIVSTMIYGEKTDKETQAELAEKIK